MAAGGGGERTTELRGLKQKRDGAIRSSVRGGKEEEEEEEEEGDGWWGW